MYLNKKEEDEYDPFLIYPEDQVVEGEGLKFTINRYGYIENINKVLVPNLTKIQRRFFGKYLKLPNENKSGTITVDEIDRFLFHAYRLEANDVIFKTGMHVKIKLSGYIFRISERKFTDEDMKELSIALYDNNNANVLLSGANDLDGGYSIKTARMKDHAPISRKELNDVIRYRYNITPCLVYGIRGFETTCRIFKSDPPTYDQIRVEQYIRNAVYQKDGLIFIGGATGQGKSSLIASIIHNFIYEENPRYSKIAMFESPIEQLYENIINRYDSDVIVSQTEVPFHLASFNASARNALRRALDIAVVGESRDYETISTALEFSQQGGLLFTTVHVNNSVSQLIYRVINMFPEEQQATKLFELITAMRLCVIQRLEPCLKGGRVAIREMLEFTPEIISKLNKMKNIQEVTNSLRDIVKEHGISMTQSARRLYEQGEISEETLSYYESLETSDVEIL